MAKKKTPIAEYIMLDKNDPAGSDYITVQSDSHIVYRLPSGHTSTLTCTGDGVVFAVEKKLIKLDYAEAATLMHLLGVHNKDGALCNLVRYKLIKDKK